MTGTRDIIHQGMLHAPRVLVVDDDGGRLDLLCERANRTNPPLLYGCEPVFIAYGPQRYPLREGVLHCNTMGEVAAYALDRANGIEGFVSDLYTPADRKVDAVADEIGSGLVPYGLTLLNLLKQNGFAGPMALYALENGPERHRYAAGVVGAVGLFTPYALAVDPRVAAFAAVRESIAASRAGDRETPAR